MCVCVCVWYRIALTWSSYVTFFPLLPPRQVSAQGVFRKRSRFFANKAAQRWSYRCVCLCVCVCVCVCVCLRPGFTSHLPHLSICCLTLYIKLPIYPKQALTRRESYYASGMQHNTYNIERHHLQNSSVLCLFPSSRLSHRPRKYYRPHFWTFRRAGGEPAGLFIAPDCKTFQGYENTGWGFQRNGCDGISNQARNTQNHNEPSALHTQTHTHID